MYSLLDTIGNTPLVKISHESDHELYAKLEYLNPGGSIKDRSALYMIEYAEKNGLLKPGGHIIDASSGNHGIAVAMIGAIKGYPVTIVASTKSSTEKIQTIKAYGARVVLCPPTSFINDSHSYHAVARQLVKETPGSFMPDQYFNTVNADAHYSLLGPEIWKQTNGKITHFFAAAGTGGTVSGAGRFLKEQNPDIKVIAVDTATSFYSTKGNPKPYAIDGMGIDFISPVMDYDIVDEIIPVTDADALETINQFPRKYGLLAGMTSGTVACAAFSYLSAQTKKSFSVMIFGDSGRAYLSKNLFDQCVPEMYNTKNMGSQQKELV
jgi:cystathionine beta-synthase